MKLLSIFFVVVLVAHKALSSSVECEKVETYEYNSYEIGSPRTCFMEENTIIDAVGVTISSRDRTVEGLSLADNKKIKFLPEKIADKFPNLILYRARSCSIENISKTNFRSLGKLINLVLFANKIEKIPRDTFEDLTSLKYLHLGKKI